MDPATPWQALLEGAPNVVVFDVQGRMLAAGNQARHRLAGVDEQAAWWGLQPPPPGQASVTREHKVGKGFVRILWKSVEGSDGTFVAAAIL